LASSFIESRSVADKAIQRQLLSGYVYFITKNITRRSQFNFFVVL